MKFLQIRPFLTLMTLILLGLTVNGQNVDTRIVQSGNNIRIQVKRSGLTNVSLTNGTIVNYTVTLKYDSSYGMLSVGNNVSAARNAFVPSSVVETSGANRYLIVFQANSPTISGGTFTIGASYVTLVTFDIYGGCGTGEFEISNDLVPSSQKYYWEVNSLDVTGSFDSTPATDITLGTPQQWTGDVDDDYNNTDNWLDFVVPTNDQAVYIPQGLTNYPILSNETHVKNIEIESGASLSLNGQTLGIRGDLTGDGTIIGSSNSSILFNVSSASGLSTLHLDQTSNGSTNVLKNLTINSQGEVIMGDSVRIIGVLTPTDGTITTNDKLIMASTGATTYGQIAGTGSGTFSGGVKFEKTISNTNAGWRQIGLPVTATITSLRGIPVLTTSHATSTQRNVFYWDATDTGSNVAAGWKNATNSDNQTKAYSIYGSNSTAPHNFSNLWWISGAPNSGTFNFSILTTTDPASGSANNDGWNLIPNPYPSNLDITHLFGTTFGSVGYKAIHVWNQTASQYQAICSTGVSVTVYNGTNNTGNSATVIPPFQAFWVKANTNTTFSLTNANRTTSMTGAGTFLKKNFDLARINIFDQDSASDQTVLYFHTNGDSTFDTELDAYKLMSLESSVPSIYAINSDGLLSVNALSEAATAHHVALGFRSSKTGQKSFSLEAAELDAKWFVYLEDKQMGVWHDLRSGSYVFNQNGNTDSRFVIHFQLTPESAAKVVTAVPTMNITGDGKEVYVYIPSYFSEQRYEVEVFDLSGRRVYHSDKVSFNHGMNTLNLKLNETGYYVVRVLAKEEYTSGKVYIR